MAKAIISIELNPDDRQKPRSGRTITFAQVTAPVGRPARQANRSILIEGDPLPVRLRRSRASRVGR